MSGLYPSVNGANSNHKPMKKDVVTFAEVLQRNANYTTGYVGKWHLNGREKPGFSNEKRRFGFDENKYQFNRGHWKYFEEDKPTGKVHAYTFSDKYKYNKDGYATDFLFDKGIDFMRRQIESKKHFALMMSIPDPHGPNKVRAPYDTMYNNFTFNLPPSAVAGYHRNPALPEWADVKTDFKNAKKTIKSIESSERWQHNMRNYFGMVKLVDDKIGELISFLDDMGQQSNTIVVFTRSVF